MKNEVKKNIFALVLILVVFYFGYRSFSVEGFTININANFSSRSSEPVFMSAKETAKFIMLDPDNYSHNLNIWDLIARHVALEIDYRRRSAAASLDFTDGQKKRILNAAKRVDKFFDTYRSNMSHESSYTNINGVDMNRIPWVFALTKDTKYEDGLPHTRANIIFISTTIDETPENLFRILVHEKVHLYQRLYPQETKNYLTSLGYFQWKYRQGVPRIRSNPDVDPWIYIDPKTEAPMFSLYSSDKPTNICDTINTSTSPSSPSLLTTNTYNDSAFEHPYEFMAYSIEKLATSK